MQNHKGQSLLQGATILAVAMIVVKLVGAVFKIPLGNILDGEGMGYFSTSYSVFTMVYAFSTAGLPAAIAKMVAEQSARNRYRDIRKLHIISVKLFFFMGLIGMLLLLLFSKVYVSFVGTENAWLSVVAISPAIFFGCMMSAYRGYYEGLRNMTPTAISQIVEVVAKLIFGLSLSIAAVQIGKAQFAAGGKVFGQVVQNSSEAMSLIMSVGSAAAIFGVTLSTFVGTAYLMIKHKSRGDFISEEDLKYSPRPMRGGALILRLMKVAIPISLGSIVLNVAQLIDTLTINNRLSYAFETFPTEMMKIFGTVVPAQILANGEAANFIFGAYSGYALSVFNLVPAFTGIFGRSALPNVTAAWTAGNKRAVKVNIESVIRMTSLIAIPASFGIFFMAQPILTLLYPGKLSEVLIASEVLKWQGISLVFLGLTAPLFAILQGLGKVNLPPLFMLVGAILKFVVNFIAIGIPSINVNGAAAGTGICYFSILVMCLVSLGRITGIRFRFLRLFVKPIIAGLACGLTAYGSYFLLNKILHGNLKTLLAIGFAGIIYVIVLLLIRGISKDDVLMLPKGEKFAKLLAKYHLLG